MAPQTILAERYAREVFDGLAADGIEVRHFVPHADGPQLIERIERDQAEPETALRWRRDHVDRYTTALPWLRKDGTVIDTTSMTPTNVASRILAA